MYKIIAIIVVLAVIGAAALTCSPAYIARAAIAEAKILNRRQSIRELVRDPATDSTLRHKLRLVLEARSFAQEALGLEAGQSYTTYSRVPEDTLLLVLSAAPATRFVPYTWWFPIVGEIPYKGFFEAEDALAAARELRREGYDVYLRPSAAFSTLGWFNDPVLSTALEGGDVEIVSTVIHELTHNTLYLPSRAAFNESFANFVGSRGAAAFFCGLEGDEGERCRLARASWHDNVLFGRWLQRLIDELEALYAREDLSRERTLELREEVYAEARERFRREVAPELRSDAFRGMARVELNNAKLIAWRTYYDRLGLFEQIFQRHDEDLAASVRAIVRTAEAHAKTPYDALAHRARRPATGAAP